MQHKVQILKYYITNLLGEDYQELTQREESDLEYMILHTESAISNIEAFTEKLSKELSVLDGVKSTIKSLLIDYLSGE